MVIHRSGHRALKVGYPLVIEKFLQANARRRISIKGKPSINNMGDVTHIKEISSISEVESSLEPISFFESEGQRLSTNKPLSIHVKYDLEDGLYVYENDKLGIDSFSESYEGLRQSVLDELGVNWRNYALASDEELDDEAIRVKKALLSRFSRAAQ